MESLAVFRLAPLYAYDELFTHRRSISQEGFVRNGFQPFPKSGGRDYCTSRRSCDIATWDRIG